LGTLPRTAAQVQLLCLLPGDAAAAAASRTRWPARWWLLQILW